MGQIIGKLCCYENQLNMENSPEKATRITRDRHNLIATINLRQSNQFSEMTHILADQSQQIPSSSANLKNIKNQQLWRQSDILAPCSPLTSTVERMSIDHKISENDFSFHDLIGIGGFSRVYLAHIKAETKREEIRPFAIKTISKLQFKDQKWDQFMTELKILSIVSNRTCPFLTKLYCSFQSDYNLFFCLEYVPGGSLRGYLEAACIFDMPTAQFIAAEVLLGLTFLHEKLDIIHRDLKPENVLIDADGHCKLTDFGLSKIGKMEAFSFCGTFNYIAPELINKHGYNKMVDYWMLGCLVYELLVGKSPFEHKNKKTMFDMINAGCYKANKVADPIARDLISKLLITNPKNRLGSQGVKEVTRHPFFKDIDFKKVIRREIDSPIKPYVTIRKPDVSIMNNPNEHPQISDMPDSQGAPQMHLEKFSWVKLRKLPSDIDTDFLDG